MYPPRNPNDCTEIGDNVVDLIDHRELLLLFRDYIDECIENYNHRRFPRRGIR